MKDQRRYLAWIPAFAGMTTLVKILCVFSVTIIFVLAGGGRCFSLETEEEFKQKLEELADDPTLSREERIQRHRKKLSLMLERRRLLQEEEKLRQQEALTQQEQLEAARKSTQPAPGISILPPASLKPESKTGAIIYFEPMNLQVKEGETFLTQLQYADYKEQPVEEIRLAIKYDKRFLLPLRVYDYPLHNLLEGEPEFKLDEQRGIIQYGGKLRTPLRLPNQSPLIIILWKALKQTLATEIGFQFGPGYTYIQSQGLDYLGTQYDNKDGVIIATIGIQAQPGLFPLKEQPQFESLTEKEGFFGIFGVGLNLVSPKKQITANEEFVVDVVLLNPEGALIDDISLLIKFDPQKLEVIDWDNQNWIRSGVNVQDGFAHDNFPFDFHKLNQINQEQGEIKYWMGLSQPLALPTAPFVRIKFRAKQSGTAQTLVYFDYSRNNAQPTTDIKYFGISLLDKKFVSSCHIALL